MIRLARALMGLSPRERRLIALLVVVALPAALWLALAEPLLARRAEARAALAAAEDLRGWVLARGAELAALPAAAPVSAPAPVGLGGIESRLAAAGLVGPGAPAQLADAGEGAVALRLPAVEFTRLMDWLDRIEAEAGYRTAALALTATDPPGTVAADLRLEPAR